MDRREEQHAHPRASMRTRGEESESKDTCCAAQSRNMPAGGRKGSGEERTCWFTIRRSDAAGEIRVLVCRALAAARRRRGRIRGPLGDGHAPHHGMRTLWHCELRRPLLLAGRAHHGAAACAVLPRISSSIIIIIFIIDDDDDDGIAASVRAAWPWPRAGTADGRLERTGCIASCHCASPRVNQSPNPSFVSPVISHGPSGRSLVPWQAGRLARDLAVSRGPALPRCCFPSVFNSRRRSPRRAGVAHPVADGARLRSSLRRGGGLAVSRRLRTSRWRPVTVTVAGPPTVLLVAERRRPAVYRAACGRLPYILPVPVPAPVPVPVTECLRPHG
ncbi:hypothetical protein T440DRAFT_475405 [Plenodomus tracheiphilus IPT5]|uniref:Uncharacterized protein n=1 Tax=Plenodomus tracheiphilus IPT5 TaxID=1408161 RepID=A0A6A7BIB7_9PLEO|nr:hypothetical protein T440DRAFT_475405 [Plenodomus tracheiphilus IPT5]